MLHSTNTSKIIPPLPLYEGISAIADAGFPAIDLTLSYHDYVLADDYKQTAKKIVDVAAQHGAIINQVHAPFSGKDTYETNLVPLMPRMLEFAGLLGAKVAVIHPIHGWRYSYYKNEMLEKNLEFYSSLAKYAKDSGVKIGLENMWMRRPVSNYIEDSLYADPFELAGAYDDLSDPEAFTVCLDLGHVAICGREPVDAIKIIGNRIGALHVHDVDYVNDSHTLPGQGKLEWDEICRALAEINYSGDFTLEPDGFTARYPKELIPSALRMMSDVAAYYAEKIESYKTK